MKKGLPKHKTQPRECEAGEREFLVKIDPQDIPKIFPVEEVEVAI